MKTLIRGGMLVTDREELRADLLVENGKIAQILHPAEAEKLAGADAEVIDASGKYVLPGAVDIHTHMDLDVGIARVIDDFYDGTVAAACGGTT